jgi:hypothetical protein
MLTRELASGDEAHVSITQHLRTVYRTHCRAKVLIIEERLFRLPKGRQSGFGSNETGNHKLKTIRTSPLFMGKSGRKIDSPTTRTDGVYQAKPD